MTNDVAAEALSRIPIEAPAWKTHLVAASAETDLDPGVIWRTWTNIEDWPAMSPMVVSAWWTKGQPWRVGSEFTQDLRLGFPYRKRARAERIASVEPGVAAEWAGQGQGLHTVHMWRFEPLDVGGVRITNVEVFCGSFIGVVKPLVTRRWQRLFQAQVDGLIHFARESA